MVIRPCRADVKFGPERSRARISGRAWVLVPFDTGGIRNDQVEVAILVDVGGLHVRGPATGGPDRVLVPAGILIPVHAATPGGGHHDVALPVAIDVAQRLAVRITWVIGIDDGAGEGDRGLDRDVLSRLHRHPSNFLSVCESGKAQGCDGYGSSRREFSDRRRGTLARAGVRTKNGKERRTDIIGSHQMPPCGFLSDSAASSATVPHLICLRCRHPVGATAADTASATGRQS